MIFFGKKLENCYLRNFSVFRNNDADYWHFLFLTSFKPPGILSGFFDTPYTRQIKVTPDKPKKKKKEKVEKKKQNVFKKK